MILPEFKKALIANQKIQLTVWDLEDDQLELHYYSHVLAVDLPLLKVAPPPESQAAEIDKRMQAGIVVGAILEAYPTPFIFYPLVHDKQDPLSLGYWLKIPDNPEIESMHRRRHVRIPMVIPVGVEYAIGPKTGSVSAYTEDMSGGGLLFTSSMQFHKGQELTLHVKLAEEPDPIQVAGVVVFAQENRVRRRTDDLYATACQFINIDARQEMLIMRECFRHELKKPV